MTSFSSMFRREIREKSEKLDEGKRLLERFITDVQDKCPHTDVVEGRWVPAGFFPGYPPFRVCRDCGYAEEGWGCGHRKLPNMPVPVVERGEGMRLALPDGKVWSQDELWR